jgi:hypothetical protein
MNAFALRHSLFALLFFASTVAHSAEALPAADGTDASRLIEQLDAPGFAERQEASRKLSEAGKAVFPELEKAAESGSREVASRAVEVFKRHFEGGDDETKQAARGALERLAKSGNAPAAQQAISALNPQPLATIPQINQNRINPALIPLIQQRGIQIQVGNLGPNVVRRTRISNNNGLKEIEIQDGDKVTKIRDVAGGIEAETTEKVNGKETTRKVEAKNLDELKQKDADAARIYEQYNRRATPVPIPAAIPAEMRQRQIESIDRSIERAKAQLPDNPAAQRMIDSLERLKQQIQNPPGENAVPAPPAPLAP